MIDVLVVGGGPAGLLTAGRLAGAGLDVLLLEEHAEIGEPAHCTGIVSMETADLAKIPDDLVLGRLTRARLIAPDGREAHQAWTGQGSEAIVAIDRAAFDQSLARQAAAAGAVLRLGTRVQHVEVAPDAVTVHGAHGAHRARTCVLACGVSYRFQRQLGLGLPVRAIHTTQVEVDAVPAEAVELHFGQAVAPGGFLWTVPVIRQGRSRLKIGLMAWGDASAHLGRFLARPAVQARLLQPPSSPVRRLLPLGPITKTYAERLLVVGDAGGFTKPTTGGGIYYSLLTASLAAETLLEAFQVGRFDEAALQAYEARWHERLGTELRIGDWLRHVVSKSSDAEVGLLIRAMASQDVQTLVQTTARFNWHRDIIVALVRHPNIAALLFRTLFR